MQNTLEVASSTSTFASAASTGTSPLIKHDHEVGRAYVESNDYPGSGVMMKDSVGDPYLRGQEDAEAYLEAQARGVHRSDQIATERYDKLLEEYEKKQMNQQQVRGQEAVYRHDVAKQAIEEASGSAIRVRSSAGVPCSYV